MNDNEDELIEEIKQKYKFTLDYSNDKNKPNYILKCFLGRISFTVRRFHFDKRISIINELIENNKSKMNINILEAYQKKINEIESNIKKYKKI